MEAFKKTTRADDAYWEPHQHGEFDAWSVYATGKDDRVIVATGFTQEDAEFVCAVHGVLPDLVRRLEQAIAQAEAADLARDEREHWIAELVRKQEGTP